MLGEGMANTKTSGDRSKESDLQSQMSSSWMSKYLTKDDMDRLYSKYANSNGSLIESKIEPPKARSLKIKLTPSSMPEKMKQLAAAQQGRVVASPKTPKGRRKSGGRASMDRFGRRSLTKEVRMPLAAKSSPAEVENIMKSHQSPASRFEVYSTATKASTASATHTPAPTALRLPRSRSARKRDVQASRSTLQESVNSPTSSKKESIRTADELKTSTNENTSTEANVGKATARRKLKHSPSQERVTLMSNLDTRASASTVLSATTPSSHVKEPHVAAVEATTHSADTQATKTQTIPTNTDVSLVEEKVSRRGACTTFLFSLFWDLILVAAMILVFGSLRPNAPQLAPT